MENNNEWEDQPSVHFAGLNKAAAVAVWSGIAVVSLALTAVLLRMTMALVRWTRRRHAPPTGKDGLTAGVTISRENLLDGASLSMSSRASSQLSINLGYQGNSQSSDDLTRVTTISGSHLMQLPSNVTTPSLQRSLRPSPIPLRIRQLKSEKDFVLVHSSFEHSSVLQNNKLPRVALAPTLHRLDSLDLHGLYRRNWDQKHEHMPTIKLPRAHSFEFLSRPTELPVSHQVQIHRYPRPGTYDSRNALEINTRL